MKKRITYSKDEKRRLLKEWQESSIRAKDFALQHGILPNTFYKWQERYSMQSHISFVEVSKKICTAVQPETQVTMFKLKADRLELEIPLNANEKELLTLFKALGSL